MDKCFECFRIIRRYRQLYEDNNYEPEIGQWCTDASKSKLHWSTTNKDRPKYKLVRTLCGMSIAIRKERE